MGREAETAIIGNRRRSTRGTHRWVVVPPACAPGTSVSVFRVSQEVHQEWLAVLASIGLALWMCSLNRIEQRAAQQGQYHREERGYIEEYGPKGPGVAARQCSHHVPTFSGFRSNEDAVCPYRSVKTAWKHPSRRSAICSPPMTKSLAAKSASRMVGAATVA